MTVNIVIMVRLLSGTMTIKNVRLKKQDESIPIARHPSRHWDCYMSENDKKETEKLWK